MFVYDPDSTLCPHHQRQHLKQLRQQDTIAARELLADTPDFSSASSVNAFLGKVAKQLVHKRISRLDAMTLTSISQSLLQSHLAIERQFNIALDAARREERLDGVFRLVPGTSRVPVPPTASAFRDDVKARMEGEGERPKRRKKHVPLPDTPAGFADAVAAQMPGANGNAPKGESPSAEAAKNREKK